jgi:AP-1 complex subunit gamma-1
VDLLDTIRTSIYATPVVSEYLLNAFIKLTTRFQQPVQINRIRNILALDMGNLNVELQQRAVEYENLFKFDDIRKGVVERMPAPEIREENRVLGEVNPKKGKGSRRSGQIKVSVQKDLLDILGGGDEPTPSKGGLSLGEQAKNAELLKDLFGSGPSPNGGGVAPSPAKSNVSDIMDLFGSSSLGNTPAAAPLPAITGSNSISALDDIFGRTAEPSPPPAQSYR